jgi:hypothetical protein
MEHSWGPRWASNGGSSIPAEQYVSMSARLRQETGTNRGRQYEVDQVRSGTVNTTWVNKDGALDPANTSGPWYGHIQLFAPYRLRAQWPPTVNLLTQVQATGGDQGGYSAGTIPAAAAIHSDTDTSGGSITASGTAWQGATVLQFTVPSTTASGAAICYTAQPAVEPGLTYSQQLRVRDVTASTSVQAQAYITWWTAAGAVISTTAGGSSTLTGSATAAWTQLTVTGTAPATAAYWTLGARLAATSPGSSISVQVDGWQLEQGSAPTTWVAPNTWYPVFGGFAERYPQAWSASGTYGTVSPTIYDAFALLSQHVLRDPLTEEIDSRSPRFLYALGDPQDSGQVADSIGNMPAASIAISKYGAGSLTLGTQITAASAAGMYAGSTGTVGAFANPNPGTSTLSAATYVDLHSAGIKGPAGGTWSRMIAFRYTATAPTVGNWAVLWAGLGSNFAVLPVPGGSQVIAYIDHSGHVNTVATDDNSAGGTLTDTSINVVDSNWHLVIWGATNGYHFMSVDGNYTLSASAYATQSTLAVDNIGAFVDVSAGRGTYYNLQGNLSFATEWPTFLGATDCSTIYTAWRTAFAGESSGTRYARILGWAGYTGATDLQTGVTTSMGSAVNVAAQDALTALQAVVDTENGTHYVARDGTITFRSRGDRYNKLTPVYVFGENAADGEIPYEGLTPDYDATHVANQVVITQQSTSQTFTAQNTASSNAYGPRTLTRTVNVTTGQECQDAANYLLSRYAQPSQRIASLLLHPSANPTVLWPVCLALEIGTRVRVMRRPPSPAAAITVDCFVESLVWRFDDKGEAWLTLQCSPVDTTPYGIFASFHTTLANSPGAGASTVTINTGADTTNVARAQLTSGQQLVLGQGTANQETVTIATGGVPVTSPGWATCVLTLASPTTKSHTAGDVVCEPLPTGITDPTTWDATSTFDNLRFTY